jgi:hypothetical protein
MRLDLEKASPWKSRKCGQVARIQENWLETVIIYEIQGEITLPPG